MFPASCPLNKIQAGKYDYVNVEDVEWVRQQSSQAVLFPLVVQRQLQELLNRPSK
jgi:hypothetical protein